MKLLTSLWAFGPERVPSPTTSLTFLGLDFKMNSQGDVILDQGRFTKELLEKYGMLHCNPLLSISMDKPPVDPDPPSAKELQDLQAFAGNFNWLATRTRPDLSYFTSLLSSSSTHQSKWSRELATKMLRYLAGSIEQGVVLTAAGDEKDLKVYTDAGFAGASTKSQNGLVVLWGGSILTWRSSRASLSALSTAEAELCSAALGWQVTEGIRYMLASLGVVVPSITVYIDNAAALTAAQLGATWRTRYYAVRAQRLLEEGRRGTAILLHCPTLEMVADALTKLASKDVLAVFRDVMNGILPKTTRANRTSVDPGPQNRSDEAGDGPGASSSAGLDDGNYDDVDYTVDEDDVLGEHFSPGGESEGTRDKTPAPADQRSCMLPSAPPVELPKEFCRRSVYAASFAQLVPTGTIMHEGSGGAPLAGVLPQPEPVQKRQKVQEPAPAPAAASAAATTAATTAAPADPSSSHGRLGQPVDSGGSQKKKPRRGKPRNRPGASERKWALLENRPWEDGDAFQ